MVMTPNSFLSLRTLSQRPDLWSQLPKKQNAAFFALGSFQSVCHRDPSQGCTLASNFCLWELLFSSSPPRVRDLHLIEEVVVGVNGRRGDLDHEELFSIYHWWHIVCALGPSDPGVCSSQSFSSAFLLQYSWYLFGWGKSHGVKKEFQGMKENQLTYLDIIPHYIGIRWLRLSLPILFYTPSRQELSLTIFLTTAFGTIPDPQ